MTENEINEKVQRLIVKEENENARNPFASLGFAINNVFYDIAYYMNADGLSFTDALNTTVESWLGDTA